MISLMTFDLIHHNSTNQSKDSIEILKRHPCQINLMVSPSPHNKISKVTPFESYTYLTTNLFPTFLVNVSMVL